MNNLLNLDPPARTELLAHLVASHLLARQMTGEWLSAAYVVESTQLWLKTNGRGVDVIQRVMLSSRAVAVARRLEKTLEPAVTSESLSTLFCESLRLDFRSPVARAIYRHCVDHLFNSGSL
ncbi:MAG: unnamed protein product [uncultured Paraburkholderia sp.]|nr:MAG: hypothetical protein PCALPYG08_3042 [uncultured Paraburkholderia sp.]CAH2918623.1 MAG: unnamed protein product [uncultured Paraburkholderia sp.]